MTTEPESVNADVAILREREAAMREILHVISASRADPAPVFETILKSAARLSSAPLANLCIVNDLRSHWTLVAHYGEGLRYLTVGKTSRLLDSDLVPAQSMRTASVLHVEDLADTDLYRQGDPGRIAMVEAEGMRTILGVPLLRDDEAIGCITLFRRKVKAFAQDEIELVETFAAQAVIAIENVRQFREVQERLERERASREILEVISLNPDNEQPVFDAIINRAAKLCRAPHAGLLLRDADDQHLFLGAANAAQSGYVEYLRANPHSIDDETSLTVEAVKSMKIRQYPDVEALASGTAISDQLKKTWKLEPMRTLLYVPLIKDDRAIGTLALYRLHVEEFSDEDIEILQLFAAQAVIAIENVRQFREVRRRLERETATKNILRVISQSSDDELPVFDTILANATRLCKAPIAGLVMADHDRNMYELVASRGAKPEFVQAIREAPPDLDPERYVAARAIVEKRVVHVEDLASPTLYGAKADHRIKTIQTEGIRTALFVPLILDTQSIGAIGLWRREVKPFHAEEISLVETFAAQAVIAIENTRQFKALETLNAELGARVDEQVGELERMGRLKRFLPSAVADAVVTAGDESMLSSHRALIATLFCDLRGFTAFCEAAEPEETIEVLQTYHQEMSDLIDLYGGGVDQRAGDGIMVIFNDPIPADDPAGDAVRLALAMRGKMRELCAKWKKLGHRLGFGVGISFGYATVGLVGSAGRYDYTASGTSINTAARLCDIAANDEILISPRTRTAVEGAVEAESRGEVEMKGIREPVEVFVVVSE